MRILILANFDVGLYNFRRELLETLVSLGHEVYASVPIGEKIEKIKNIGCQVIDTKIDRRGINPSKDIKLLKHYFKILKDVKPDVVLSYTVKPNTYGGFACMVNKIPYMANITGLGTALENGGVIQKIIISMYKVAFSKIHKVFFQNNDNEAFFTKHKIALGKHKIIPGSGVNINNFTYKEYPSEDKIIFSFISRIMKEKGIDNYLDAAERIKTKYPNTEFHICGFCEQDSYKEKIENLQNKGIVIFHGMVDDVHNYMYNSHCIVHPTYYPEGLSNVLLEASACGRPIITTGRAGCKEVIDDKINGYIVKQDNSDDLTEKIEKFINLPHSEKKAMGEQGRKKVEREFDRKFVVQAYLDELEAIASKK